MDQVNLKVDFVNDVSAHFGEFASTDTFPRVDSWRNILSNKICALSRQEAKDFVDVLFIARTYPFGWEETLNEAREKDLWVEPIAAVSMMFNDFPGELMKQIKWITPVDYQSLHESIRIISDDVLYGRMNSLK